MYSFSYYVAYACIKQRKVRCRKCKGLETQKYGKGRIHCRSCGYTFRPVKKHHKKDSRWIKSYLLDGSSLRRLGERWNVGYVTAWRRIQRTLNQKVEVGSLIVFKLPKEIPIILLDAKHFKIRKQPYTLYVSFDATTSKPLSVILLPRHESKDGYDQILRLFRIKSFKIEAVVSDADQSIRSSVKEYYPACIHQKCAFHLLAKAFRKLNGRKLIQSEFGKRLWNVIRKMVLEYDDLRKAQKYLSRIRNIYTQYPLVWKLIERNLGGVYEFTKRRALDIPRTSNKIENFMGRLEQRLKTFRTSKNPTSLIRIVTQLIKYKYKSPTKR